MNKMMSSLQNEERIAEVRLEIEQEMFWKDEKIEKLKRTLEAMMSQKSKLMFIF